MFVAFLAKHRHVFIITAAYIAVGLACFAQGCHYGKQHGAPVAVPGTVTERIVEKGTTVVNQKVDLQELAKLVQDAVKNVKVVAHVTTKTVKAPDGTVTTEQTTDTQRDSHSEVKTDSSKDTKSETQAQTKAQTERVTDRVEVFVPKLREPTWDFLIGVGASVPAFLGGDAPKSYLPVVPAKFAGALTLTHHVAGPVKAGLSLNTRGDLMFVLGFSK